MARALTPDEIVAAFDKWGVKYRASTKGWRGEGQGDFESVHGIVIHHTGDDAPDSADERVLVNGRPGLEGRLCNWGMTDDGTVVLVASKVAWHAGKGSSRTLSHVTKEDYSGNLTPGPDDINGNRVYYGQETMYSGKRAMTREAYVATVLACAAILDKYSEITGGKWTGKSVIGHKEHTSRKPDPASQDMADLRSDIDRALAAGPKKWPTVVVKKPPVKKPATTHKVAKGESLSAIAAKYHLTLAQLIDKNPGIIQPGATLKVK